MCVVNTSQRCACWQLEVLGHPQALRRLDRTHMSGLTRNHDDVIKWKLFPRYWPFVRGIHRSTVNSLTKASDAELWYFLWSRINGWVNNREAVDLRRHHAHYDVTVMLRCNFVDSMISKYLYGQTQTLQIVINIGVRKRISVSTVSKILAEAEM